MKRCSRCDQTYVDDSLNFCLADGGPLVSIDSEPTVVIPRPAPRKKRTFLLWLALAVAAIMIGVVIVAAGLVYKYSGGTEVSISQNQNSSNRRSVLDRTPTPTPSPSPTMASDESDESEDGDPTPVPGNSDEVTPIGWETTAGGFQGETGRTYTFECPSGGSKHPVYGSDTYTDYSSICTAAVHVGVINLESGGIVTIEYRPGRAIYGSTVRHDVKSNTAGEYSRSFVIRKDSSPAN